MSTVIVQAHPVPDSLSAALLGRVVGGLDAARVAHRVFRLSETPLPGAVDIVGCRQLVLVYPTWWGGQPAMLLDWLHDMLEPKAALGSVDRLIAVTSLGSGRVVNRVQGEWGRAYLKDTVLAACAPCAAFEWLPLYKVDRQPPEAVEAHLRRVEDRFSG